MAIVEIGKMDKRVTFQTVTAVDNDALGEEESKVDLLTTWAHVKKISGSKSFNSGYPMDVRRYDIWCYYRSSLNTDIKASTRIVYDGMNFSIDDYEKEDEIKSIYHFEVSAIK